MELEKQVCNLELAKRLKELGVEQYSYFHWFQIDDDWHVRPIAGESFRARLAAFTAAELGEMIYRTENGFRVDTMNWNGRIRVFLNHYAEPGHEEFSETEADARAKMLIYLIENKLVAVDLKQHA